MKNTTLITLALALACALPAPLMASGSQPAEPDPDQDNVATLVTSIEDPTTAFINLDAEGVNELGYSRSHIGYNSSLADEIISYASNYLGRPYRRGGKSPAGFDCSGFTSFVFKNFNISLSPSSRTQYTQGEQISRDDIQPGDLLFFSGRGGGKTVGHVALAVSVDDDGRVTFIHAATSGGIRRDTYPDGGYYSRRFIGARRVIE